MQKRLSVLQDDAEIASLFLGQLEKIRDRTLASLHLGKQAPEYKIAKQALDKFIEQLLLRGRVALRGTNYATPADYQGEESGATKAHFWHKARRISISDRATHFESAATGFDSQSFTPEFSRMQVRWLSIYFLDRHGYDRQLLSFNI